MCVGCVCEVGWGWCVCVKCQQTFRLVCVCVCVCWVERELAAIQSDFLRHDRRSERDVNMFPF